MSRGKLLIIIAVVILVIGGWMFLSSKKSNTVDSDGTQKSLLSTLFPFGKNSTIDNPTQNTDGGDNGNSDQSSTPNAQKYLTQITSIATAGYTTLPTDTRPIVQHDVSGEVSTEVIQTILPGVRFAERGTGYLYDTDVKGQNLKKVSGTIIARTAEALFADNGATAILRYIKTDNTTIATFLGKYTPSKNTLEAGSLTGAFLPEKISTILVSADQKSLLYLLPTPNGSAAISIKTDGTGRKQLWSSAFSEWILDWANKSILATTKASGSVPGYAYTIDTAGTFQKIIGGVDGLTTKSSPNGKYILYSVSGGDGLSLRIHRTSEGTSINTGLQTLPEKCVWGTESSYFYCAAGQTIPKGEYPDDWYKGAVHFNDSFWKVQAENGTTEQVNDGEGNYLDATNLSFDQTGKYLVFINKKDTSLWSLDTNPNKVQSNTSKNAPSFNTTKNEIVINGDTTETNNCGSIGCFQENFKSCTPANNTADMSPLGTFSSTIIGKVTGGCSVKFVYTKNINPTWVNQPMTCTLDNTKDFEAVEKKVLSDTVQGTSNCTGPLASLLRQ